MAQQTEGLQILIDGMREFSRKLPFFGLLTIIVRYAESAIAQLHGVKMSLGMTSNALKVSIAEPAAPFDSDAMEILNKLRLMMARVKCAARVDVFKACALLSNNPTTAATAYAEALLRILRHGLNRSPTLYHPGATEVSDDEAWLLRILLCARHDDEDSLRFLTTRRLAKETLRPTVFLVRNLAAHIDDI